MASEIPAERPPEPATPERRMADELAELMPRLVALAARRLSPRIARRGDAEDIAQSTVRTFLDLSTRKRATEKTASDLWHFLAGIAVNKCRAHVRRQQAARRDVRRELPGNASGPSQLLMATIADGQQPAPSQQVLMWELASATLARLSAADLQLLQFKLSGRTTEEIADELQTTARTVRRRLAELEARMQALLRQPDHPPREQQQQLERVIEQGLAQLGCVLPIRPFGDFLLQEMIGAGGMGKVFRALDRASGEMVAVKALAKRHLRNPDAVQAFLSEAELTATLNHPGIVPLLGMGRFPGGGLFLVLEFVRGTNLEVILRSGTLPVAESLRVLRQVVGAVGAAHELGIVHCDLKPANILVDQHGNARVADFGFAQWMTAPAATIARTAQQQIRGGTPAFAAPELWDASLTPVTPAADFYSLGKILTAMLPKLPTADSRSPALRVLGARLLATDPRQRIASAAECLAAIAEAEQEIRRTATSVHRTATLQSEND